MTYRQYSRYDDEEVGAHRSSSEMTTRQKVHRWISRQQKQHELQQQHEKEQQQQAAATTAGREGRSGKSVAY